MPLMTLSIELLPAPLGPMMARISCSRTSKLTSVSAFTPPNASEMLSSSRMTSPPLRTLLIPRMRSRRPPRRGGWERGCVGDAQIRGDHSAAAVLEAHLRFDVLVRLAAVERLDEHGVFLGDKSPAHLARARQLVVVRVELLVQNEKTADLRRRERTL